MSSQLGDSDSAPTVAQVGCFWINYVNTVVPSNVDTLVECRWTFCCWVDCKVKINNVTHISIGSLNTVGTKVNLNIVAGVCRSSTCNFLYSGTSTCVPITNCSIVGVRCSTWTATATVGSAADGTDAAQVGRNKCDPVAGSVGAVAISCTDIDKV